MPSKAGWATLSCDIRVTNHAIFVLVPVLSDCTVRVEGKHKFSSRYIETCARARPAMFDPIAVCLFKIFYLFAPSRV